MSKIETLRKDEKQYADFYNGDDFVGQKSEDQIKVEGLLDGMRGDDAGGDNPTSSDVEWTGETTTDAARAGQGDGVAYKAPDGSIIHNGRIIYQGRIW